MTTRNRALAAVLTLLTLLVVGLAGATTPAYAYTPNPDPEGVGAVAIPEWIRCPRCPIEAISFDDVGLPPQYWQLLALHVEDGMRDLGLAAAATDPTVAKAWHEKALADFTAAAGVLGQRPLRFKGVWLQGVDGEAVFVEWWRWEESLAWSFVAGQDLAAGLNLINAVGPPPGSEKGSLLPPIPQPPITYFQDMYLRLTTGAE